MMPDIKPGDMVHLSFDAEVAEVSRQGFPRIELVDMNDVKHLIPFVPEVVVETYAEEES